MLFQIKKKLIIRPILVAIIVIGSSYVSAEEENLLVQIQSIAIAQKMNGTIITIATDGILPKDVTAWEADNGWFYVTLVGCRIDTSIEKPFTETGIVIDFQSLQMDETVQLNFQLSDKLSAFNILDNGIDEVLISMRSPVGETVAISDSGNILEELPVRPNPLSYLVMATGSGLIAKGFVDSKLMDFLSGSVLLVVGYVWMRSPPTEVSDEKELD
jgi:hypothetical protein